MEGGNKTLILSNICDKDFKCCYCKMALNPKKWLLLHEKVETCFPLGLFAKW